MANFRRGVLATIAVAVGTLCAAPLAAGAARFAAPDEPMILTRVLERELGDGNAVVVTRSWQVRFVPGPAGYRLEGEQVSVEVDAPPRLAALAEVERGNPQHGLFPMALDEAGLIVTDAPAEVRPIPGLTEAAEDYLADAPEAARARAMRYTHALQQAGAEMASHWPRDLFFPATGVRTDERTLALPGGASGTVAVSFGGTLDPADRHLATAERLIETKVGDSTRTSRETWLLEPLD